MKRILAIIAVAGFLAACSSTPDSEQAPAPVDEGKSGAPAGTTAPVTRQPIETTPIGGDPNKDPRLTDPKNILSKRSIYFDFDSFVVKDEYRATIEAHARYLLANSAKRVVIQGNTDERGSREYNLALGQKRAEAVRRAMSALGVPDRQMEAVSFGEERPRASGTDEASYAENRRADLAYQ